MTRPRYHLTAAAGHVNDPLGVTWLAGRYHLFFQLNPHAATWSPRCSWGQVDAADLVRWEHPRIALAPDASGAPDHGCWSGALVVDRGVPTILYTSVAADDLHRGRVALARADAELRTWTKDPARPGVDGPPAGLDAPVFRDPFVWRSGEGWRMLLGAGLADGAGAALQYSSADLRRWSFDGVLCRRSRTEHEPVWTGAAWECPQLVPLDGAWLLVVSAWADDVTHHVACAVGDYDGTAFTPRTWRRLLHGDAPYATTTFRDAAGRRCAMSWCRELPGPSAGRPWAGVLSVPVVLSRDGDRPVLTPHPDVDTLRTGATTTVTGPEAAPVGAHVDVTLHGRPDLVLRAGGVELLRLSADPGGERLHVDRPGLPAAAPWPLAATEPRVRLLCDGDLVEVFTAAGAAGAVRVAPVAGPRTLEPTAGGRAVVHEMQRWFPA